mmetsp:Transcript_9656/g.27066  ORF Transcript_9656/g.27066 Transcript_9656/m.27066 type:complete len:559 (+) Transcript_9656:177-1853(+)
MSTTTTNNTSCPSKHDGYYWLAAFLPTFFYLLFSHHIYPSQHEYGHSKRTLFGLGGSYAIIANSLVIGDGMSSPDVLAPSDIFYLDRSSLTEETSGQMTAKLTHPLEAVIGSPYPGTSVQSSTSTSTSASTDNVLHAVHSLSYHHDPELGRGYLLLSDAAGSGRIWRWEVGGGPITIGRSLHMERSGCRSNLWTAADHVGGGRRTKKWVVNGKPIEGGCPPNEAMAALFPIDDATYAGDSTKLLMGSTGLTVEIAREAESARVGTLVVVERGERRIVRIEEDGARTPLVLTVPSPCANSTGTMTRLGGTGRVLYGPFGDLIFTDTTSCGDGSSASAVYILREAVNVPPLPAPLSREAHEWKQMPKEGANGKGREDEIIEILFDGMDVMSDIALGPRGEELYVAGRLGDRQKVVKVSLDDDDDDGDAANTLRRSKRDKESGIGQAKPFFDLSKKYTAKPPPNDGTAMAVDNEGNVYASYIGGIVVIDSKGTEIASLALSSAAKNNDKAAAPSDSLIVPTAMEIGDDGYLYVSASTSLMRIRSHIGPAIIGTNMVIPAKK